MLGQERVELARIGDDTDLFHLLLLVQLLVDLNLVGPCFEQLYPTQLFESWSSQNSTFEKLLFWNFNFSMGMKSYFRLNRKVTFFME